MGKLSWGTINALALVSRGVVPYRAAIAYGISPSTLYRLLATTRVIWYDVDVPCLAEKRLLACGFTQEEIDAMARRSR